MNAILISESPLNCENITKNKKTLIVRKTKPSIPTPFKVYIYCTKTKNNWSLCDYESAYQNNKDEIVYAQQHVIGEFICDKIETLFDTNGNPLNYMTDTLPGILDKTAMSFKEFQDYVGSRADKNSIYGWHISHLKIYDTPKPLSEFRGLCHLPMSVHCDECPHYSWYQAQCTKIILTRAPTSWCYVQE